MAFLIHQWLTSLKSLHEFWFMIFRFLPENIWYSVVAIVISFYHIWFLSLRSFHLHEIEIWVVNWSSNNLVIILRKFFDVNFLYFLNWILFPSFSDNRGIKLFWWIIIFSVGHCFMLVLPILINLFFLWITLIGAQILLSHFYKFYI